MVNKSVRKYNRRKAYLRNSDLEGLHEVTDFYEENKQFEGLEFNEDNLGNGYFIILNETPESPEFITTKKARRLIANDIRYLSGLSRHKLIWRRSGGNVKNRYYSITKKGSELILALRNFEQGLEAKLIE